MKTTSSKPLTARQQRELDALIALPEEQIDTTDIPEQRDWSGARRGVFLIPARTRISASVDAGRSQVNPSAR